MIRKTYGHDTYYLMAVREAPRPAAIGETAKPGKEQILGVLPLVHFRHPVFGNELVSMPFMDGGGILADGQEVEQSLFAEAVKLARRIGATQINLRCELPVAGMDTMASLGISGSTPLKILNRTTKVRMLLSLPASSELLTKSFKSKLRSQINKPLKAGCTSRTGGVELLEDFYKVFLTNMRDLGSPVHSVELMRNVLGEFPELARIMMTYKSGEPVAAAMVIGFKEVLRNPWASSDRKHASMSPNMLLYLRMLEFACDNGYKAFDFGRSTVGEGTYRFKEQWGAAPVPLHWYLISLDGKLPDPNGSESKLFETAVHFWKKLPLGVTRILGPRIRKHISL